MNIDTKRTKSLDYYTDIHNLEYEFNAKKFLAEAEEYIHKAVEDDNYVWIVTSDGRKIMLDEKCKIGFLKIECAFK